MALSTNSVFHFTTTMEKLESIIKGSFNISYCEEQFKLDRATFNIAIPMVSFCDIPLSQVTKHIISYGGFGIGLSKNWASSKGLNPVLYMQPKSQFSRLIEPALIYIFENDKHGDPRIKYLIQDVSDNIAQISNEHVGERKIATEIFISQISFIKNHIGDLHRYNGLTIENYRFYDEREWRYIPTEEKLNQNSHKPFMLIEEFNLWRGNKDNPKPIIKDFSLDFSAKDVDYIIVENESQINRLIKAIRKHKKLFKNRNELDLLITKIITSHKIKNDM
jgi:hypothetical protein